jgi:hypothetical protein
MCSKAVLGLITGAVDPALNAYFMALAAWLRTAEALTGRHHCSRVDGLIE